MSVPLRVPVSEIDHVRGTLNAPVVLVAYQDFESTDCRIAHELILRSLEELRGDLQFIFRHFPLTQHHKHAFEAAKAAEAAGLQGFFWEMHDILFENQGQLDGESLLGYAEDAGCDGDLYWEIMSYPQLNEHIEYDVRGGLRSGVNSVPTLFVNGIRFAQPLAWENLSTILKKVRDGLQAAS